MARNGSGTYSLPAGNPFITGTVISSTTMNNTMTDIATALTNSLAANGETQVTANLPMNNFKFTGLAAGTAATDSVRADQIQGASLTAFTTGGTGTAFTLTPTPAITAYTANQTFDVIFNNACGAAPTLQISGVATPPNLVRQLLDGSYQNLAANDFPSGWQSDVKLVSASQALVLKLPPRIKIIASTRDMTAATGSVSYTGVGFKPRKITAFSSVSGVLPKSTGVSNLTQSMCLATGTSSAYDGINSSNLLIQYDAASGAAAQSFIVTSLDADGLTGTWTKTGTPGAATCQLIFCCEE